MPQKRTEKQTFQNVRLAVACPLGGQWTEANITRWLSRRGGVYTAEVNEQTTHLICTVEEYKAKGTKVKQAAKLGTKQCKIVTLDWLEDSLLRDKKLPVKDYLLNAVLKNERAKESQAAKVAKGNELAERFVNTNLYHVYADASNFFYEIVLTRDDAEAGWQGQKYILYLFESNAKPHLYQFAAKFYQKPRDTQPKYYRPSETPQKFWAEYERFKSFFLKKTGIDWDERLVQISLDESLFQYKAPIGGKPVGYVPASGQRKPSSLSTVATQVKVKAEPGADDVKFSAAIQRLAATQGTQNDTNTEPSLECPQQPLMNDQTLAVAMDVDALVKEETMDIDGPAAEVVKQDVSMDEEAKEGASTSAVNKDDEQQEHCPAAIVSVALADEPQSETMGGGAHMNAGVEAEAKAVATASSS